MKIVKYRKIWFTFSGFLIAASVVAMWMYGFNLSIDFLGGTITEVRYLPAQEGGETRPEKAVVEGAVSELGLGGFSVRPSEADRYIIRTRELSAGEGEMLVGALGSPVVERQNTVGPVAGAELQRKAMVAVAMVILMIVIFVTFAFRKVSRPVASWKYGLATIVALVHDVIVPVGVFVVLGHFLGLEIDLLFVSGILAILGYSVHDTIVVFDRVREHLRVNGEKRINEPFEKTVGESVAQTMGRSINTSLTLFVVLVALYFVGSSATRDFSLLLLIGVVSGTYSSIFLASPLLVSFQKFGKKK